MGRDLLFRSKASPASETYEEILYLGGRTQSLEQLLVLLPERVCAALALDSFHIFLREQNRYVLQRLHGAEASKVSLPASCSIVSRLKRDRRPAAFVPPGLSNEEADGWQMLATPFEMEVLGGLGAQLLLPLEGRAGLMGFVTLSRPARRAFTADELSFVTDLGPQMGRGLETAQLVRSLSEEAIQRDHTARELELAREVQQHLLPKAPPSVAGIDLAAFYRSAERIGGDYYDFFVSETGVFFMVVADASGKGLPAALLMASLRASLHALMLDAHLPIPSLLERVNSLVYQATASSRYATLFMCLYEAVAQRLTYVNAGHNPPFLLRADGTLQQLCTGGTVLGLLPSVTYESETLQLHEGDRLLVYTDGVTEAINSGQEEFGTERLQAVFSSKRALPGSTKEAVEQILLELEGFTGEEPQNDDITLLVLRCGASH